MKAFDNHELERRVDEVLYYIWDPIGVSDQPCAREEYGSYVPYVLQLVEHSDDADLISADLANIVRANMGLSPDTAQCDRAANMLLRHKWAVQQGLS
jgi:hypothetical protein